MSENNIHEYYCKECDSFFKVRGIKPTCPQCGVKDTVSEVSPCCLEDIDETRICPHCKANV